MQAQRYISKGMVYDPCMPAGRPSKRPRSAFGERLSEARRRAGFSQQQLADKLGVSQRTVAHWERAKVALRADQLVALAHLLGVSADFLIGLEVPKQRESGPVGRTRRVLETVSRLPRHRQQKIIEVVEALVAHGEERP